MFNLSGVTAFVLATTVGASALAAGYEKSILWSGRHGGVGGTGAAWSVGSEALVFNPAGLATEQGKREATLNLSPTTSLYEAPTAQDNVADKSERAYYLVPSLFYGANPTDKFGYGIGVYAAGGSKVEFKDVDLSFMGNSNKPTLKSSLSAMEASLGVGYKILPGLKIGVSYRFGIVDAEFTSLAAIGGANVAMAQLTKLQGTQHGFRGGVQWTPEDKPFGLGVTYRSTMHFQASGDLSGTLLTAGGSSALAATDTSGTVKTIFPQQINFGGFYDIEPDAWRVHAEYVWTQYSRNQFLAVEGLVGGTDAADIQQHWRDQNNVRLGVEYSKTKYPIRLGYVWNSGVEDPSYARAIFAAPGKAHTLTLGTGRGIEHWDFNIAGEYTVASRDDVTPAASLLGARTGDYKTSAAALHAGVTYKF